MPLCPSPLAFGLVHQLSIAPCAITVADASHHIRIGQDLRTWAGSFIPECAPSSCRCCLLEILSQKTAHQQIQIKLTGKRFASCCRLSGNVVIGPHSC